MLKGILKVVSPELVKTLCEMGHGDEIVIADGNFPAETFGKRVIRADGIDPTGRDRVDTHAPCQADGESVCQRINAAFGCSGIKASVRLLICSTVTSGCSSTACACAVA